MLNRLSLVILYLVIHSFSFAQDERHNFKLDSVENVVVKSGIKDSVTIWLKHGWLFNPVDNKSFSEVGYNDSAWVKAKSTLNEVVQKDIKFSGFGWFRYHLSVDSFKRHTASVIYFDQKGASEIFIDGKLHAKYGTVSLSADNEQRVNPSYEAIYLPYKDSGEYVIAVRFSNSNYKNSYNGSGMIYGGFIAYLTSAEVFYKSTTNSIIAKANYGMALFVFFCVMGLLHLLLFIFYSVRKSNLYFSLFCFLFSFYFFNLYVRGIYIDAVDSEDLLDLIMVIFFPIFFVSFLSVLFSLFDTTFPKKFKYYVISSVVAGLTFLISGQIGFVVSMIMVIIVLVESISFIVKINKQKRRGAVLISAGFGTFIAFIALSILKMLLTGSIQLSSGKLADEVLYILLVIGLLSIPISMSAFLAWDFSLTSKNLSKKLIEVEELSARSIEQEKEKQKILAEQNNMLEVQVKERTKEIEEQKKLIEEKNKDITDSINYAQRIQRSILPSDKEINDIFPNSFVLFKPRDIVSGDFYQFKKVNEYKFAIMADCTGHGVPGALMSMIGSNLLHQIIIERQILKPNLILSELHKEVKSTLRQSSGAQSHDGMDTSIALYHENKLYIASANRPVYLIINKELTEIKPTKRSIGGSSSDDKVDFEIHEFDVIKDQMLYMFSDGYSDQFGGEAGKKFKLKNLAMLLANNSQLKLEEQFTRLDSSFTEWKGHLEQVDDVCVIGIRF
ncbi:MAG: SpoIIE family protein phosphatase [Sphingobacteriaceae bacterium]